MKVLYVTTVSNTVNAFLIPHIQFLLKEGYEVGVAFNKAQEIHSDLLNLGCKIYQIAYERNPLKLNNIKGYKQIRKIVEEEGYNLIHVHTPVASFFTRLACRNLPNVKVLYTAHGFHFFKGAPMVNWVFYYPMERIAARWTDGLITINQEDYAAAGKFKLKEGGSVYHLNGVGLDLGTFTPQTRDKKLELRKEYGYKPDDFILISVGELRDIKQQDLLIMAVSRLKNKIPNLKLLLAGEGDLLNDYSKLAHSLGLGKNVEFLGFRHDIHQLMALSDIAVSTSRREGLPVNVMEAMATGLPLIVTDCRGNRDLVTDGKNGFVIGVSDFGACTDAIYTLYQSTDIRQRFAKENLRRISLYSHHHIFDEMKKIYSRQFLKSQAY